LSGNSEAARDDKGRADQRAPCRYPWACMGYSGPRRAASRPSHTHGQEKHAAARRAPVLWSRRTQHQTWRRNAIAEFRIDEVNLAACTRIPCDAHCAAWVAWEW